MRAGALLLALAASGANSFHIRAPAPLHLKAARSFRGLSSPVSAPRYHVTSVPRSRSACLAPVLMSAAPAGDAPAVPAAAPKASSKLLKVTSYFTLWYLLNIAYNIYNKRTLNMIPIPWILSSAQLFVGSVYVAMIWALKVRKAPELSNENIKNILPLAALHTGSHISAVVGLGAGAVGFVHIVKAMEPFFTAVFSAIFLKQYFALPVYAALVPVVGGVALASLTELTFNWVAFGGAMGSNVCAAARGVLAKASMDKPKGKNMDAGNLYGVMTILATLMTMPLAAIVEGPKLKALWSAALARGATSQGIWKGIVLSGLSFYMYNEVAFYCLNAIHPITHAVGNTIKRVVLIGVSVVVFQHELTPLSILGSSIAIAGVLLYSLAKNAYAKAKKA